MTKLATEYTPVKVAPPEREMSHLEKEGGVVGLVDYLGHHLMGRWTRHYFQWWEYAEEY